MAGDIVVGYDGSNGSDAALDQALALAERLGCGVVLAFCFEPPAVLAGGAAGDQRDAIEALGETRLNRGREIAIARGITVHAELVDARPVEGLIAAADKHDAIMIAVGHHGEGPLRGALLGATANLLLHQAERPVLVVPSTE